MPSQKQKHTLASKIAAAIVMTTILLVPNSAVASSWSPTLLVNTEAFQTIDDGDGSTDIELRFGTSGNEIKYNVTSGLFEFDTGIEVVGTASGRIIHAQDSITTSGSLMVQGATTLSGAVTMNDEVTFGSGLIINGVTYRFPSSDGSVGQVLHTDGNGNLTWDTDDSGASSTYAGQGLTLANSFFSLNAAHSGTTITATDTLASSGTLVWEGVASGASLTVSNGFFGSGLEDCDTAGTSKLLWDATTGRFSCGTDTDTNTNQLTTFTLSGDGGSDQTISHGNTVEIAGGDSITTTASATDTLTIDITDDTVNFAELADALSVDANTTITLGSNNFDIDATSTGEFRIFGTASGSRINADTALTSSGTLSVESTVTFRGLTSCTNLTTDSNGVLSCNNTDYLEETELDTEAELEAQLTDVTNVFTNNDGSLADDDLSDNDTDDLSEGSGNLYFTNERVDDRVNSLLQAGTGITLTYDDGGDTLTIHTSFSSSGSNIGLSPEYDGATYYGDGANNVGQLVLEYDSTNKENYYKWTSTQSSLQDYNIAIRVKLPDNFQKWDESAPIEFRYRTNAASSDDNQIDVTMLDTAGSSVALTGGSNLANTSWTTATITGPEGTGTYTQGDYITLILAVQARTTNSGEAHAGYINLNFDTANP